MVNLPELGDEQFLQVGHYAEPDDPSELFLRKPCVVRRFVLGLALLRHEQCVADMLFRRDASLGEAIVALLECDGIEANGIVAGPLQLPS